MRKILYYVYQPYKWLFYFPFWIINTIVFGILAVIFSLIFGHRIGSFVGGALWSRLNGSLVPMIVSVKGRENIKKNTSYLVVPNHQSNFDIFLIYGWLGIDIKWIMKKELKKIPGLGFGSQAVGHIFLDRSNSRKALESLEEAKRKLVNGTSVVIFPEGTRSETGQLQSFKRGAFKLALDLNLPLLPITIIGTKNIMPKGTINLFPGKVKMIIHPAIEVQDIDEGNINVLMEKTREALESGFKKV